MKKTQKQLIKNKIKILQQLCLTPSEQDIASLYQATSSDALEGAYHRVLHRLLQEQPKQKKQPCRRKQNA